MTLKQERVADRIREILSELLLFEVAVLAGLRRAGGFLRREMGRQLQLRRVPEIRWYWDETLSHTDKIEALLNTLDLPKSDPAARPDDEGDDDE